MANEENLSNTLVRDNLRIRKHQMRQASPIYFSAAQTETVAADIYEDFKDGTVPWERTFNLSEYLVRHTYLQKLDEVQGDSYAMLCAFGQYESEQAEEESSTSAAPTAYSSRRVVSAVSCFTIEMPDTVYDQTQYPHHADIDTLMMYAVGDAYLTNGCYVAVFASNDEHPPAFGALVENMETPGAEKMGENCWAGYLGDGPTAQNVVRYLRTNVVCDTNSQGGVTSGGIKEKLLFKIHDWAINDYNEETDQYDIKKYLHIMLFLTKQQYTETRNNWIEGSAIINLSSIALSFTKEVVVPSYVYDLCGLGRGEAGGDGSNKALDLQGSVFSLVNIFRMTDAQAAPLSKQKAEACVFSAIESALMRIRVPNAVYGFRNYPPITPMGFDFYTVGVGGEEYVRIGCIDENAMSFASDTPLPSVYGLLMGYPINPGFTPNTYYSLMFTNGVDMFSGCIRLQVVIYKGMHSPSTSTNGQSYGFGTNIDASKFDAVKFFSGEASTLALETGEQISLTKLYFANHTKLQGDQEFVFNEYAKFETPGFLLLGASPVDFSQDGTMNDGDWGEYMPPEYRSQYMQLVEWPISQIVKVSGVE